MHYEGAERHEPHNLGNPAEFTMQQLAEEVNRLFLNGLVKGPDSVRA